MSTNVDELRSNALHEKHTIFPISDSLRHGKPLDLLKLWIGFNFQLITVTTGIIDTTSSGYGLPLSWSILAILLGNLAGGAFMALHSAQGAHLGVSQMQQSRAQFGSYGALPILILVVIMYVGYFSSILDIGEQAISSVININSAFASGSVVVGLAILGLVAAYVGYDLIHKYAKLISYFGGAIFLVTVVYSSYLIHSGNIELVTTNSFTMTGFFGAIGLSAIWQISYAPYVSDYSRYLPKDTGPRSAFWMTYSGTVISASIAMALGAVVGLTTFSTQDGGYAFFTMGLGLIGTVFVVIWSISGVEAAAAQLYCSTLTTLSINNVFFAKVRPGRRSRLSVIFIIGAIGTYIALFSSSEFMTLFTNFIYFLLYVLVPWSVINLVDYYLIRDGSYSEKSLYENDTLNSYVNIRAILAYTIGFIVEIPFMSNALFTGFISKELGGADISWLVSTPIVALLYFYLSKKQMTHTHIRLSSLIK